jgi:hypothetical protein
LCGTDLCRSPILRSVRNRLLCENCHVLYFVLVLMFVYLCNFKLDNRNCELMFNHGLYACDCRCIVTDVKSVSLDQQNTIYTSGIKGNYFRILYKVSRLQNIMVYGY